MSDKTQPPPGYEAKHIQFVSPDGRLAAEGYYWRKGDLAPDCYYSTLAQAVEQAWCHHSDRSQPPAGYTVFPDGKTEPGPCYSWVSWSGRRCGPFPTREAAIHDAWLTCVRIEAPR